MWPVESRAALLPLLPLKRNPGGQRVASWTPAVWPGWLHPGLELLTGDAVGCHGGTEGPAVSLVTGQLLGLAPGIPHFTEGLQNADDTPALSFPLH